MSKVFIKKAFTLIELLVVVAIIALLISILLPSLSQAREQGKRAVCLSHLKSIGQASHSYAAEDRREMFVPLSMVAIRREGSQGMTADFFNRFPEPASFGGRTPTKGVVGMGGNENVMRAQLDGGNGYWEAHRRPINGYVYGSVDQADAKKLEMFHCPSDTGFPTQPKGIPAADWSFPNPSLNVPFYDILGNSYRINSCGFWYTSDPTGSTFSTGAMGHIASTIDNPSRIAMFCEPIWYILTRLATESDPTLAAAAGAVEGWHKKLATDVVCYCDGSGRMTRADQKAAFDQATLTAMNVDPSFGSPNSAGYILRRGKTWQTDTYPAPGAFVLRWSMGGQSGQPLPQAAGKGWPFANHTTTENPDQ